MANYISWDAGLDIRLVLGYRITHNCWYMKGFKTYIQKVPQCGPDGGAEVVMEVL